MSSVDALLKDGNLNVSVEVLVAVPNPSPQKPPLHRMSLPATSEVAEEGSVEEDEAAVVVSEVVFKGTGEGLAEVTEEDLAEGMTEEVSLDEAVSEGVSKIEEIVVLVDLANNREGLAVQEAQVDTVDREEGTVAVVAASVVPASKMEFKADKVEEALGGVEVTNATTTTPVDLVVMVEEAAVVVVGSGEAVEVTRTGIPRGCGIEMFYLFDSFTQFSVRSDEEIFAEAVRSIVGAFAQV